VLGHNVVNTFEFRPDKNESAERDDGRNLTFRNVTLPFFYVVTVAGLVGLWRVRRRRGAELLLLQAGYFTAASLLTIGVPRLRVPLDLATAIGAGVLVAQRRVGGRPRNSPLPAPPSRLPLEPRADPGRAGDRGGRGRRQGSGVRANRVEANARSQLERGSSIATARRARLARSTPTARGWRTPPSKADSAGAGGGGPALAPVAALAGDLRTETRDTATSTKRSSSSRCSTSTSGNETRERRPPPLGASRTTYETEARP
jgi:hypothetical protein